MDSEAFQTRVRIQVSVQPADSMAAFPVHTVSDLRGFRFMLRSGFGVRRIATSPLLIESGLGQLGISTPYGSI